MTALTQHQVEIEKNLGAWERKPLLQQIYAGFYQRILRLMDETQPALTVEIGSGIGNLKAHWPRAVCTDLFPNPWLDLVCDGYELPFRDGSIANLVLFDVFHHLEAPQAFLAEARRALTQTGRLILFEPFISLSSYPVYALLHHEPVALFHPLNRSDKLARPRRYYAAQGNATRLFFRGAGGDEPAGWNVFHREAFSAWNYLLSGGYSKPSFYPSKLLPWISRVDALLSRYPALFGGRCLVGLTPRA